VRDAGPLAVPPIHPIFRQRREWQLLRHKTTGEYVLGMPRQPARWEGPVQHSPFGEQAGQRGERGIHAFRPEHPLRDDRGLPVHGRVLLWGRLTADEFGHCAEHALVQELWLEYRSAGALPTETDPALGVDEFCETLEVSTSRREYHLVPTYDMGRDGAQQIARALERRYGCEVHLHELTREEWERRWKSTTP
jgi:hypothetical protein